MINEIISQKYSKETQNIGLGCANLQPFFDIKKGNVVLDLGCGNGNQAAKLCEIVGEYGFIYGLDITNEMIEKANGKNSKDNVQFFLGDIHNIPLKNDSVDTVLSNCVINHSTDKKKVFSEIYRILKNRGHFLIGDVMSVEKLPEEVSADPQNIADCWGGAIQKDKYIGIIKETGFINIRELSNRQYYKNDFLLESIIIKGEKNEINY